MSALAPGTRIVAAMSGGVDSSVAAALLKRQGYDVVGITLQLYPQDKTPARKGACCAGADIHDAKRVAAALNIPHYVLDYESRFRKAVIADFAESYARGETPIPCVRCNERVKFADLMDTARELGAAALATGHYVRRIEGAQGVELHAAADASRDQSYFLFATTKAQLDYLRFPLGDMEKTEVRAMAAELGLVTAAKPDSQDICFVPQGRYTAIVDRLRPDAARPGEIVDRSGAVLGRHDGIAGFTVGQRKGLGLSGHAEPLFVLRLDAARAQVVVGPRSALASSVILLKEINWLAAPASREDGLPFEARVKVRSMRPPVAAQVTPLPGGMARVELAAPEEAIAPGQACVFYQPGLGRRLDHRRAPSGGGVSDVRLRFGRPEERERLEDLQRRAALAQDAYREALLANPDMIALPRWQLERACVRVAEMAGAAVGFSVVLPKNGETVVLDGLFVEPSQWKRGIGRALVEDACARAKGDGARAMAVVANPYAEGFYRRLGFARTGTGTTALGIASKMRRDLTQT